MTEHQPVTPGVLLRADEAIQTVLQAEQASHDSLRCAQQQAQQQLDAARAQARRIDQRTEARIRAVVCAFERRNTAQLAKLAEQAQALSTHPEPTVGQLAALDTAVRVLARQLSGAGTGMDAAPAARNGSAAETPP